MPLSLGDIIMELEIVGIVLIVLIAIAIAIVGWEH